MRTLEARVAHLEHQNRLLRATLGLAAIALVTCGGITSNYERVNTNHLVIVDHLDQPRITLSSEGGTLTFHGSGSPVVLDAETIASLLADRASSAAR